ncbi:MAG: hypothetical protein JST94_03425 [Bacteroidetes bacterium]|nr:hypothetical protein [Bacteroidota bacterium]MBS1642018.1 hypothetical protein [Bacteroidota bacterium]MBS1670489.1 hypothetical protein [Bacteroidota bacterium]
MAKTTVPASEKKVKATAKPKAATASVAKAAVPASEKKVKTITKPKTESVLVEKVIESPAQKIRNACFKAFETFQKINDPAYTEIQSKLGYVIGSYDFDKNPIGLYEFGEIALPVLKKIKEENTKRVTKQIITDLEKALEVKA